MPTLVKKKTGARWRLHQCTRCGGDLYREEGEWKCLQCGREENGKYPFRWAGKKWVRLA